MSTNNIYKCLEKIHELIAKSFKMPLTPFVMIHEDKLSSIIEKIYVLIPAEVKEAHNIINKRDDLYMSAQERANQLLIDAKHQAETMLSESELLKAVQSEADKIRHQVVAECEAMHYQAKENAELIKAAAMKQSISIREGADRYAETVLCNLNEDLTNLHNIVRNGQQHLAQMKAESAMQINEQKNILAQTAQLQQQQQQPIEEQQQHCQ